MGPVCGASTWKTCSHALTGFGTTRRGWITRRSSSIRSPNDATLRNLCLISGAAAHVPEVLRETCPDIPWRSIIFVRHAYFLGAGDPCKALKTTLKAEINEEAWSTLRSDTSRPFDRPSSGRIAVKVINHLGDEVMKVFRI